MNNLELIRAVLYILSIYAVRSGHASAWSPYGVKRRKSAR